MDINQQKINKKLNLQIGVSLFLLIALIGGFTYAFFNYTRTSESNTLKLGNITFETSQNGNINLTNAFPISITRDNNGLITNADDDNIDTVEILVNGHTTYSDGVEYLVSSANTVATITSGNNTKQVPISLDVQVGTNGSGTNNTLGTSDNDYFDNKDTYTTSHYKILIGNTIKGDEQILVGYIAPDTTGTDNSINGKITIKAYFDKDLVAITDTQDENNSWIQGRTVLTTSEWNSLRTNGVSFQVKVEAQEGRWVEEPATPESCFTTTVSNNEVTITGYDVSCGGTDVIIPNKISGNMVSKIGNTAFTGKGLTSVTIPHSVTIIGNVAFAGNQLTNVTIPDSVTTIESAAFNSNQLSKIDISENVTSIGSGAFAQNQLIEININSKNLVISNDAFNANSLDKTVFVNIKNIPDNLFYGGNDAKNITSLTLGEDVEKIGKDAFASNKISRLVINENIKKIGYAAFGDNQLTYIEIDSPDLVFDDSIIFDSNNELEKVVKINMKKIPSAFRSLNIKQLELGNDIEEIEYAAFANNQLTNVSIPSSVTTIGYSAFAGNQLTNATIPYSVTSWYCNAFDNTVNIDNQSGIECTSQ